MKQEQDSAVQDLNRILTKYGLEDHVTLNGSLSHDAVLEPFWSDIDISIKLSMVDCETLKRVESARTEYMQSHPEFPLSVTVMDVEDSYLDNYFHHHGVKPLAYNYELAKNRNEEIPFKMSLDVLCASSVYRYYEILYTFRRAVVKSEISKPDQIALGYHRLSRMVRTFIEILHPEEVLRTGKINEREYVSSCGSQHLLDHENPFPQKKPLEDFFSMFEKTRKDWQAIRKDPQKLKEHAEYLIETFNSVHRAFLPFLKKLGETYNARSC